MAAVGQAGCGFEQSIRRFLGSAGTKPDVDRVGAGDLNVTTLDVDMAWFIIDFAVFVSVWSNHDVETDTGAGMSST